MKNVYLDVHVLQTIPPACVNRDDTGSPKTAYYGGSRRARVSSQAWKKAVRDHFKPKFDENDLGKRTLHIVDMVKGEILKQKPDVPADQAEKLAIKALENAGLKIKSAQKGTEALTFMSIAQAAALAELILAEEADKKLYKKALQENPAVDIALFGRMVAADPSLNYDACCQVAHAISTHSVASEYDYFTAVDDLKPEDNAGAGHIGVSEFNSSTLYRYATVNVKELYRILGEAAAKVAVEFADSFIKSMPTGKQNSFANHTLPYAIYVTIREDQPVSLVGAFEKAVSSSSEGYEERSAQKLAEHAKELYASYSLDPEKAYTMGNTLSELNKPVPLPQLEESLLADLQEALGQAKGV